MNEHDEGLLLVTERLAESFQADSDGVPPTTGVDLDRARADGRSMRRRRRAGGAGVAVVGGCLIAVIAATSIHSLAGPVPPTQPDQPITPSLGMTSGVPTSEDPLQVTLQFAVVPKGFTQTGADGEEPESASTVSDGSTRLTLLPGTGGSDTSGCVMIVNAASPGARPSESCAPSPGPGASSIKWIYKPGTAAAKSQGMAELTWTYSGNVAATLQASPGSMSAANLIKVMTQVVTDGVRTESAAVAMPFHLPAAPPGLTLAYAYSVIGQDGDQAGEAANGDPESYTPKLGTAAGLEYGNVDADLGNASGLTVTVQSAAADFPTQFETQLDSQEPSAAQTKSLTVDGHTARTVSVDGYEALIVHDVNGFDVRIAAGGTSALAAITADGGLAGYFSKITFYDTDPATWTYDVIGSR